MPLSAALSYCPSMQGRWQCRGDKLYHTYKERSHLALQKQVEMQVNGQHVDSAPQGILGNALAGMVASYAHGNTHCQKQNSRGAGDRV